jgi:PKD repeat protein
MSYDPDDDTLTHRWSFADGTAGATDVQVTHTFDSDGLYPVTLTATDEHGAVGTAVVVIEVYSGFVTGGGWITSPPGAYPADPSLTGKANFDFAAKYRRGSTVPIGATEFQFQAAGLDFHSTTYEWLVVVGPLAKFKGEGEINGEGGYGFMLSAIDGARPGGGGLDKVRIKIWDKASGMVVYDNQIGAGDDEPPTTVIGGGSIVVHRRHRKHSKGSQLVTDAPFLRGDLPPQVTPSRAFSSSSLTSQSQPEGRSRMSRMRRRLTADSREMRKKPCGSKSGKTSPNSRRSTRRLAERSRTRVSPLSASR